MNHIFKVVRCKVTGSFKAVPEFARGGKKASTSKSAAKSAVVVGAMLVSAVAVAAPPHYW